MNAAKNTKVNDSADDGHFFFRKSVVGYGAILILGFVLALLVTLKSNEDYADALERYKHLSQIEAQEAAQNVSASLTQIYQGIRTISLLPGVMSVDRYGKNLDPNAHESIVQIYNNMVSNVSVSEIYIVPVDIEPEKVDPVTGSFGEPILMYDGKPENPDEAPEKFTTIEQAEKKEEVEIYEYRLLKDQMTYLKGQYPNRDTIKGLHVPFISGHEVLTCDNDDFEKTKNNEDRKGAVFSVPFFGKDGALKGTVSAIIRSNNLKGMLPLTNAALVNQAYQYTVLSKKKGQEQSSGKWIIEGKPDPGLIFSAVVPVKTMDPRSQWDLWVGYPDTNFLSSRDAKTVENFRLAGYSVTLLLMLLGSITWALLQRSAKMIKQTLAEEISREAERKIAENQRTEQEREQQKSFAEKLKRDAMHEMAETLEFSVKSVVLQVANAASHMQLGAENVTNIAADTRHRSDSLGILSNEVAQTSSQVAAAAEELTASIREISTQTQKSTAIADDASATAQEAQHIIESLAEKSQKVSQIIELITGIAGQINLLALNATIESARAGEAGKGFAVVAREVKGLANQVGKATEEITNQINDMQVATSSSVETVMKIIGIIGQVTESTSAVASAVEEQSSITNEIARNIVQTSASTQEISTNISSVKQGAQETGTTAQNVLESAKTLSSHSDTLRQKVDEFLVKLRAS